MKNAAELLKKYNQMRRHIMKLSDQELDEFEWLIVHLRTLGQLPKIGESKNECVETKAEPSDVESGDSATS